MIPSMKLLTTLGLMLSGSILWTWYLLTRSSSGPISETTTPKSEKCLRKPELVTLKFMAIFHNPNDKKPLTALITMSQCESFLATQGLGALVSTSSPLPIQSSIPEIIAWSKTYRPRRVIIEVDLSVTKKSRELTL